MGLRCLIGHDFGEVKTDRDREERGEEVVVTVREYRECARCGETRAISENTEVRAVEPTSADEEPDPVEPAAGASETGADLESVTAEEDDGVILSEEPEEPAGRQRGEWPEDETAGDDETAAEPAPWPEVDGEDEGYDAEAGGGGGAEGVEFGGSLTPEAAADASGGADEGEVIEAAGEASGTGISRASPSPGPTDRQREGGEDAEIFCPECTYTADPAGASLRPGDICPECRMGYLTERST